MLDTRFPKIQNLPLKWVLRNILMVNQNTDVYNKLYLQDMFPSIKKYHSINIVYNDNIVS